jgi:NTP pyrophosphatase (non-canonical NTP hydrolase)
MQIREYQQWLEGYDRARGWQMVGLSHTLLHALEEMGEVARLVLHLEGYKGGKEPEAVRDELATEISDLFVFLFKLAYQCGIDVEQALCAGQVKAEERHGDLAEAGAELDRYMAQQARSLQRMGMTNEEASHAALNDQMAGPLGTTREGA